MRCISKKLIERQCLIMSAQQRRKVPEEEVDVVEMYDNLKNDVLFLRHDSNILRSSATDDIENDILHYSCTNKSVQALQNWCNNNILAFIDAKTRETSCVLIRIATSMLNKIDIPDLVKMRIHSNIVQNVLDAYADYSVGDLPF